MLVNQWNMIVGRRRGKFGEGGWNDGAGASAAFDTMACGKNMAVMRMRAGNFPLGFFSGFLCFSYLQEIGCEPFRRLYCMLFYSRFGPVILLTKLLITF